MAPDRNTRADERRPAWATLAIAAGVSVVVAVPFFLLHRAARDAVLSEVRNHAMGVAIAAAAGLDPAAVQAIRAPSDMDSDGYRVLQSLLDRFVDANPDVRFIYVMRRPTAPFSPATTYEYVVDQAARDRDRDGTISEGERSEIVGTPYDASHLPAMVEAWAQPSADEDIAPDPPYGDVISGYAPVRNSAGETVAIVGVDVSAGTVRGKLVAFRTTAIAIWLIVMALVALVVSLYLQQRKALDQIRGLNRELSASNELLRRATRTMVDGDAAQAPAAVAESRVLMDRFDLVAAAAGGGVAEVFDIDRERIGICIAETSHGVARALLRGLLSLAIPPLRERDDPGATSFQPYADPCRPADVVDVLGDAVERELGTAASATILYAVLDLAENRIEIASIGCPPVLIRRGAQGDLCAVPPPAAKGTAIEAVAVGDLILLRGDRARGRDEATEQRLRHAFAAAAPGGARGALLGLRLELERTFGEPSWPDLALLVVQIR